MADVKYPKGEIVEVRICNQSHEIVYLITRKQVGDYHYIYELADGVFKKLGKNQSPLELEAKYVDKNKLMV